MRDPADAEACRQNLAKVTVGGVRPLGAPIEIRDHDPNWPVLFVREAERLHHVLGGRVTRLEHVGSTAVRGLAAKPVIDMVLEVPDSSDEAAYVPELEDAGYVLRIREPEWFEHRVFKGPDTDINLHVFSTSSPEIQRMLVFRDRLRSHPDERRLYERTKRELADREWAFVQNYADAKSDVVEQIIGRAMEAQTRGPR
jgi:GrpB-like predicted nucleotidyltransferase (UPF0157 family)